MFGFFDRGYPKLTFSLFSVTITYLFGSLLHWGVLVDLQIDNNRRYLLSRHFDYLTVGREQRVEFLDVVLKLIACS